MKRHATAKWTGTLQNGRGTLSTETDAVHDKPYSSSSRFADGQGTNPEELIGAAHAGCFSMALAGILDKAGFAPQEIETDAIITIEKVGANWSITSSHLIVEASVPKIDQEKFEKYVNEAKRTCPVSRVLNTEITFEAHLVTSGRQSRKDRSEELISPN